MLESGFRRKGLIHSYAFGSEMRVGKYQQEKGHYCRQLNRLDRLRIKPGLRYTPSEPTFGVQLGGTGLLPVVSQAGERSNGKPLAEAGIFLTGKKREKNDK